MKLLITHSTSHIAPSALHLLPVINHSLRLAFATGQGIRFAKSDDDGNAENLLDGVLELLVQLFHGAHRVAHHVAGNFHLHFQGVHVVLCVQHNLVVRQCLFGTEQGRLDLAREHIHATHDNHVVATATDATDTADGTATFAFGLFDSGNVAGTVAENRHGLLAEGTDDQFAFFAVGQGFQGFGVDGP